MAISHPRFSVVISDGCAQDPELFNDTIMNNIKYANFDATDERKSWLKSTKLRRFSYQKCRGL